MNVTKHKQNKARETLEQQSRHFSLKEGRGVVTSMLLW